MARPKKKIDELLIAAEGSVTSDPSTGNGPLEVATKRYVSTRAPQFHPFQRVLIPTGSPGVILEMDSWVDCQIKAGIVKEA